MQARILYVQYTNPGGYPPLERSARLLADDGWTVRFLGLEGWGTQGLRFREHERISVRRMSTRTPGWRQKLNYLRYGVWCLSEMVQWSPDWVYVSDPNATPIGALITFLFDIPVLYHEHDSPSEGGQDSWFGRAVQTARQLLAHRARVCVLPNEERARLFRRQTGRQKSVHCVWNAPAREELPERHDGDPGGPVDKPVYLHYHGSVVPGRVPTTLVKALADLPSFVRFQVFGYEPSGREHVQELHRVAKAHGVQDRVGLRGPKQHSALLDHAQRADIGVSFMPVETENVNMRHMVGASNKAFEYLACGLPLLVSNRPEWRETYVEPGYGRACDPSDPEDIAETVRTLIQDREALTKMGEAGQEKIYSEWNYETEFEPVRRRLQNQIR